MNASLALQVTANNSISLVQFDYAVKFEEEYRETIASGWVVVSERSVKYDIQHESVQLFQYTVRIALIFYANHLDRIYKRK